MCELQIYIKKKKRQAFGGKNYTFLLLSLKKHFKNSAFFCQNLLLKKRNLFS